MSGISKLFKTVPKAERNGIQFDHNHSLWEVIDSISMAGFRVPVSVFLRALIGLIPDDAILYLEGRTPKKGKLHAFLQEKSTLKKAFLGVSLSITPFSHRPQMRM